MHTAGLYLTLTLTRPYANFSSLLYFMAIALNRSFCFSTVHNLTLQTLDAISQNRPTLQRLSQNHANLPCYLPTSYRTTSSAVAKRPRNASCESCLSVVSFNSTKRRVESFIVSYVVYRFITACS